MYVDVADDEDEDLYSFFKPVFQFIDDAIGSDTVTGPDGQLIKNQRRVLVHCQVGRACQVQSCDRREVEY